MAQDAPCRSGWGYVAENTLSGILVHLCAMSGVFVGWFAVAIGFVSGDKCFHQGKQIDGGLSIRLACFLE